MIRCWRRCPRLNAQSVDYVMAVHFRYHMLPRFQAVQGAVQRMMGGQATPAQVGAEVTKGIATYFAPFQKR